MLHPSPPPPPKALTPYPKAKVLHPSPHGRPKALTPQPKAKVPQSALRMRPSKRQRPLRLRAPGASVCRAAWRAGWSVATRFAMKTELAPADVTFLRFGVAAIFLWPVLLRHGFGFKRIGRLNVCIMLIGAGVPFMMLAATGMRFAPASHVATLMIGMMPIFVALLSALFFHERFSRVQLGGLATVIVGAACLGGHALIADRGAGEWRDDLLFSCAGICF